MKEIIVVVVVAVLSLLVGAAMLAFIIGSERGFAQDTETKRPLADCLSGCGR